MPETELQVANAKLALSPTQGPVGTRAMLRGEGFPAGRPLQLVWQTYVGSRVSGEGYGPSERPIGNVTVGSRRAHRFAGRRSRTISAACTGSTLRDGDKMLARVFFVDRDEHRQHLAHVGTGRHAGDDSPEGRRLDRVRQHLRRHVRQRLHGLCVRLQHARATS